jgi:bifunctional UDP-N-acetylglucosamine pyrophosphorylase/glucosamine-1-phosphate N-acetyltransferase
MVESIGHQWAGVILAAGHGVRMKSRIPKVLHQVCGKELVRYPVELLRRLGVGTVVLVVSPDNETRIRQILGDAVEYAIQPEMKGTGDALSWALKQLNGRAEQLLVLNGDVPLLTPDSVRRLGQRHLEKAAGLSLLTARTAAGQDLGKVIRDNQRRIVDIVEAGDRPGSPDPQMLDHRANEVNVGVYCFRSGFLAANLKRIEPNRQGEKYLTSLVALGAESGEPISSETCGDPDESMGVNNRLQVSQVEAIQRRRILESWMLAGVTIQDPASVYIDGDVTVGQDSIILANTALRGHTSIGEDCQIGPNAVIEDSVVGDGCRIIASMLEEATVEAGVDIGPFSHLRPGAYLESGVHLGNYVEVKNSRLSTGAVSGHFSYLGDATIGAGVNIGAGTVTCNYDGRDKLPTVIEAGAFIGCDTMLVAPVTVGANAATGAGAVVTKDIPSARLAVGVPARIVGKNRIPHQTP